MSKFKLLFLIFIFLKCFSCGSDEEPETRIHFGDVQNVETGWWIKYEIFKVELSDEELDLFEDYLKDGIEDAPCNDSNPSPEPQEGCWEPSAEDEIDNIKGKETDAEVTMILYFI